MFEEFWASGCLAGVSLPIIIPWVSKVEIISTEEDSEYNEGITGSHFGVGGID